MKVYWADLPNLEFPQVGIKCRPVILLCAMGDNYLVIPVSTSQDVYSTNVKSGNYFYMVGHLTTIHKSRLKDFQRDLSSKDILKIYKKLWALVNINSFLDVDTSWELFNKID